MKTIRLLRNRSQFLQKLIFFQSLLIPIVAISRSPFNVSLTYFPNRAYIKDMYVTVS